MLPSDRMANADRKDRSQDDGWDDGWLYYDYMVGWDDGWDDGWLYRADKM